MCTTDIYPFISADGIHREQREIRRCTAYRRGIPCDPIVFKHPLGSAPPPTLKIGTAPAAAPVDIPGASPRYNSQGVYFPPSPRLTPGQTTPATIHESDSEGGRSGASSSASREKGHRYRRPSILINDQHIPEVETVPSRSGHRRRSSTYHKEDTKKGSSSSNSNSKSNSRIIIVEAPPTPRTPPQSFDIPRTAPPSPSYISGPLGQDPGLRHRPVIVDERPRKDSKPRVRIEVPGEESYSSPSSSSPSPSRGGHHRRQTSDSSHHSRGSSSHSRSHSRTRDTASDEERRRRRKEKKEQQREEVEDEARRQRQEARIARANRNISDRPTQPIPSRRPKTYVRPTVQVHPTVGAGMASSSGAGAAGLVEPFGNLGLGWSGAAPTPWVAPMPAPVVDEEEDEEAQKERLKERWMPRRRATIGAGSRRTRVEYQDGLYRLE